MYSELGISVLYLSVVLLIIGILFFFKNKYLSYVIAIVFIISTILYTTVVYKAPETFRGECYHLKNEQQFPDLAWIISFFTDDDTFIALWLLPSGIVSPVCMRIPYNKNFLSKLQKAQATAEATNGFIRLKRLGQGGGDREGEAGNRSEDDGMDVVVVDPKKLLPKEK